jgi:hypothetical protein
MGESTQGVTMTFQALYGTRYTLFNTHIRVYVYFPYSERTVTVRVTGIMVCVVDIHEGKSEGTIVLVHCVKA